MPNYKPIIPRSRPGLHAALGAAGASIVWGIAVAALCGPWPAQQVAKGNRLDWDGLPRPPHIEPLAVQVPEPEAKPVEIVNVSPTPVIPTIVPREDPSRRPQDEAKPALPPDTSPRERSMIANGCSPGGVRTNFYVRGVWHYRCRY
jgi:hypothetical protein